MRARSFDGAVDRGQRKYTSGDRSGFDLAHERELGQTLNAKAQRQIQLRAAKGSQEEIDTLDREVNALEIEYQQVQASIRKASPAYAALTRPSL